MKDFLFTLLYFGFSLGIHGQNNLLDTCFSNKAEAKNLFVNGLKEGKWVEYFKIGDNGFEIATCMKKASISRFTIYNTGKPFGIVKEYYKNGKLKSETPYIDGNIIGVQKKYSERGELIVENTVVDGKENGVIRIYYESGKLSMECPFTKDESNSEVKLYIANTKNT